MNEEELKAIWQKEEKTLLENINFEEVKQKTMELLEKARKRTHLEIGALIFATILAILVGLLQPKIFWLTGLLLITWVLYLTQIYNDRKLEQNFQRLGNAREFLEKKKIDAMNNQKSGKVLLLTLPILVLVVSYISLMPLAVFRDRWLTMVIELLFLEVVMLIIAKYFYRFIDTSMLDEIEDLLRQLDETQ